MSATPYLRSINLELDTDDPARFSHFRPTSKSAALISAVLNPDDHHALLVVAPYGSGKSLTAGYLAHAVQNEPERFIGADDLLRSVAARIRDIDTGLFKLLNRRRRSEESHGVACTLYGDEGSTLEALRSALKEGFSRVGLGREARSFDGVDLSSSSGAAELLDVAVEKLETRGRDSLLIVWDEFGRHLERMVEVGRTGDLLHLQVLAEAAARVSTINVTLLLLLHRSFAGYGAQLPTSTRKEWNKIEGRFHVIQFVDDSNEAYHLLASVSAQQRPPQWSRGTEPATDQASPGGWFDSLEDPDGLLEMAAPLEAAALWLLPRVSARVAQNERTAFSFLTDVDLSGPVSPSDIYDYFRSAFRADTGPGGTHKAWLEAESALSKVSSDSVDADLLKTAFLLNLGLGGERHRATLAQLISAAAGRRHSLKAARESLTDLLEAKLVIHREHSDHVLIWHGTDVDLRGRLEDERRRIQKSFDLVEFLSRELPPPVWRPTRHNAQRGVTRYAESRYVSLAGLVTHRDDVELGLREPGTDAEVLYLLPATPSDRREAEAICRDLMDPRTIVVVSESAPDIRERALELAALLRMHRDDELLGTDPLVKAELDQLTDDVREHLTGPVDRLLVPGTDGGRWYWTGHQLDVHGAVQVRRALSEIMDEVFPLTPQICSEMVVKRRPMPVIINARKKVVLGILERMDDPDLGIEGDFADKAIYRAVLKNTGLYRNETEPRFAPPNEVLDEGLAEAWQVVRDFLTEPKERARFQTLFHKLSEPPFGLREGVFPILLAAGLKAFPAPLVIRSKDSYVTDILPSVIEDIVRSPSEFSLTVLGLSTDEKDFLVRLYEEFSTDLVLDVAPDGDLIRRVFDVIQAWWSELPDAARKTNRVGDDARLLRRVLRGADPATALLTDLPEAFSASDEDLNTVLDRVTSARQELADIHHVFVAEANASLSQALRLRGFDTTEGILPPAKAWASLFPVDHNIVGLSPLERGLISQMRREHDSDEALLGALSILLTGKAFKAWDDTIVPEFDRRVRSALDDVEHAAVRAVLDGSESTPVALREGVTKLAASRLRKLFGDMVRLAGADEARSLLDSIADRTTSPSPHPSHDATS